MLNHATEVLKILGGVGLFFSFSEVSLIPNTLYAAYGFTLSRNVAFSSIRPSSLPLFLEMSHIVIVSVYVYIKSLSILSSCCVSLTCLISDLRSSACGSPCATGTRRILEQTRVLSYSLPLASRSRHLFSLQTHWYNTHTHTEKMDERTTHSELDTRA